MGRASIWGCQPEVKQPKAKHRTKDLARTQLSPLVGSLSFVGGGVAEPRVWCDKKKEKKQEVKKWGSYYWRSSDLVGASARSTQPSHCARRAFPHAAAPWLHTHSVPTSTQERERQSRRAWVRQDEHNPGRWSRHGRDTPSAGRRGWVGPSAEQRADHQPTRLCRVQQRLQQAKYVCKRGPGRLVLGKRTGRPRKEDTLPRKPGPLNPPNSPRSPPPTSRVAE